MKFFIDACMTRAFADFLKANRVDVIHLSEMFTADTVDKMWIPPICKQNRVIISCDKAQIKAKGKTAVECDLVQRHRGSAFYFGVNFPTWKRWKQSACFFRAWEKIMEMDVGRGEIYSINDDARISQVHLRKVK